MSIDPYCPSATKPSEPTASPALKTPLLPCGFAKTSSKLWAIWAERVRGTPCSETVRALGSAATEPTPIPATPIRPCLPAKGGEGSTSPSELKLFVASSSQSCFQKNHCPPPPRSDDTSPRSSCASA